MLSLEESNSFKTTHTVISELRKIIYWSPDEIEWLIDIALSNKQVGYILNDSDVSRFYKRLIKNTDSEKAAELKKFLEEK